MQSKIDTFLCRPFQARCWFEMGTRLLLQVAGKLLVQMARAHSVLPGVVFQAGCSLHLGMMRCSEGLLSSDARHKLT